MKGPGHWGEHPVFVYHEVKALGQIELLVAAWQAQAVLPAQARNTAMPKPAITHCLMVSGFSTVAMTLDLCVEALAARPPGKRSCCLNPLPQIKPLILQLIPGKTFPPTACCGVGCDHHQTARELRASSSFPQTGPTKPKSTALVNGLDPLCCRRFGLTDRWRG